jgi:hypothetical protein
LVFQVEHETFVVAEVGAQSEVAGGLESFAGDTDV